MAYLIVVLAGIIFGAADQFLGTIRFGPWAWTVSPIVVGGGTKALPDEVRVRLELLGEHRFGNGVVHLHYAIAE